MVTRLLGQSREMRWPEQTMLRIFSEHTVADDLFAGERDDCIAMLGGLPYTTLRDAVLAHPTIPEGLISFVFLYALLIRTIPLARAVKPSRLKSAIRDGLRRGVPADRQKALLQKVISWPCDPQAVRSGRLLI